MFETDAYTNDSAKPDYVDDGKGDPVSNDANNVAFVVHLFSDIPFEGVEGTGNNTQMIDLIENYNIKVLN